MPAQQPGPRPASPPPSWNHFPRRGRGDTEPGPRASDGALCPGPLRPRPTPCPARPRQGCRPGRAAGRLHAGPPGGGGCHSPSRAACAASFVCKHPASRTLAVRAARPRGRSWEAGLAGGGAGPCQRVGHQGPRESRASGPLSAPARWAQGGGGSPRTAWVRQPLLHRLPYLAFPWAWDLRPRC